MIKKDKQFSYNLGFGDSFLIRELLFEKIKPDFSIPYGKLNYEDDLEKQKLIKTASFIFKHFMGFSPLYIGLCHGATGGITASIRSLSPDSVYTNKYYFSYYPDMIKVSLGAGGGGVVNLIDSPNNPTGFLINSFNDLEKTIFDAAYHNPIYLPKYKINTRPTMFKVAIGSFGKIFGTNSLRLGFFGTDDFLFYQKMQQSIMGETLGLSIANIYILNNIVEQLDIVSFCSKAASRINDNREEMSKLAALLGPEVPDTGMFYFPVVDNKIINLLEKSKIIYIDGSKCGSNEGHIRLSLGQTREITKKAIQNVLKLDRIKNV
jgi:aspartate/methionine/tyrosine aminotransferase